MFLKSSSPPRHTPHEKLLPTMAEVMHGMPLDVQMQLLRWAADFAIQESAKVDWSAVKDPGDQVDWDDLNPEAAAAAEGWKARLKKRSGDFHATMDYEIERGQAPASARELPALLRGHSFHAHHIFPSKAVNTSRAWIRMAQFAQTMDNREPRPPGWTDKRTNPNSPPFLATVVNGVADAAFTGRANHHGHHVPEYHQFVKACDVFAQYLYIYRKLESQGLTQAEIMNRVRSEDLVIKPDEKDPRKSADYDRLEGLLTDVATLIRLSLFSYGRKNLAQTYAPLLTIVAQFFGTNARGEPNPVRLQSEGCRMPGDALLTLVNGTNAQATDEPLDNGAAGKLLAALREQGRPPALNS